MTSPISSKQSSSFDINDANNIKNTEDVELIDMMKNDMLIVKNELEETIDKIKANINHLFAYIAGMETESVSSRISLKEVGKVASNRERFSKLVGQSLIDIQEKTVLDMKFVQLYDKFLARELASQIKNDCIQNKLVFMQKKVVEDFKKFNEETEKTVESTRSKLEEFIGWDAKSNGSNSESINTDVISRIKEQALNDLQRSREQSEKDISKTKRRIMENIGVFLINPTGPKTREELESEQFVKDQILNLKETVQKDLRASKEITEKIAQRTKEAIEKFSRDDDSSNTDIGDLNFTFDNLREKTAERFQIANAEMEQNVSNVKKTLEDSVLEANSAMSTSIRQNNPITSQISSLQQENETVSKNLNIDKFKCDFEKIDGKMKEDANDLKVGIADLVNNVKQKMQKE